jgi:hypothetical protein
MRCAQPFLVGRELVDRESRSRSTSDFMTSGSRWLVWLDLHANVTCNHRCRTMEELIRANAWALMLTRATRPHREVDGAHPRDASDLEATRRVEMTPKVVADRVIWKPRTAPKWNHAFS